MDDVVEVNGAIIERRYFEENLREAAACEWKPEVAGDDHQHCIVCMVAIGSGCASLNNGGRWLCSFCYEHYLLKREK